MAAADEASNMDIDTGRKKRFEIIGGNPIAIWSYSENVDLEANCTLCQIPNRFPCGLCQSKEHVRGKCRPVKGKNCAHVFHKHCFDKRREEGCTDVYGNVTHKTTCPYGCSQEFEVIKVEDEGIEDEDSEKEDGEVDSDQDSGEFQIEDGDEDEDEIEMEDGDNQLEDEDEFEIEDGDNQLEDEDEFEIEDGDNQSEDEDAE